MTRFSLAECGRLLSIDPKTLRQWLAQAQMAWHADPVNAKIKCLEVEQVQTLARLHGRVLQLPAGASAAGDLRDPKPDASRSPSRRRPASKAGAVGGSRGHSASPTD